MWIETEDGKFVNLDFKRYVAVEDVSGEAGAVTSVRIVAPDAGGLDDTSVLRSFPVDDDLPLAQARAAADSFMQGIRQAMADKSIFIRPARRSSGTSTMYGIASKKGGLAE